MLFLKNWIQLVHEELLLFPKKLKPFKYSVLIGVLIRLTAFGFTAAGIIEIADSSGLRWFPIFGMLFVGAILNSLILSLVYLAFDNFTLCFYFFGHCY